jgi:hypothetical protein
VPVVSLAVWQALVDRAYAKPGQKILVHAGSGGLGSTVIQLATHLGATVATTASGENAELVRSLGADVVLDYRKDDFAEIVSGYDLVLDSLGGENLEQSLRVLKPGGQAIGVAGPPDPGFAKQLGAPKFMGVVMELLSRKARKQARRLGVRYSFLFVQANGGQLREVAALYDAGHLRPVIDQTFPFDQTLGALAYVEQGRPERARAGGWRRPLSRTSERESADGSDSSCSSRPVADPMSMRALACPRRCGSLKGFPMNSHGGRLAAGIPRHGFDEALRVGRARSQRIASSGVAGSCVRVPLSRRATPVLTAAFATASATDSATRRLKTLGMM